MLLRQRVTVKRHTPYCVFALEYAVALLEEEVVGGSTTHSHHTGEGLEVLYLMAVLLTSDSELEALYSWNRQSTLRA